LPSPRGLPPSLVAPDPLTRCRLTPVKVTFGPVTPTSGLGSTRTNGASARTFLATVNWFCRAVTWAFSALSCCCRLWLETLAVRASEVVYAWALEAVASVVRVSAAKAMREQMGFIFFMDFLVSLGTPPRRTLGRQRVFLPTSSRKLANCYKRAGKKGGPDQGEFFRCGKPQLSSFHQTLARGPRAALLLAPQSGGAPPFAFTRRGVVLNKRHGFSREDGRGASDRQRFYLLA
jgi:hypothetical protein